MPNGEVEELEHPLLLGGGTTGLINLESSTLKVSHAWLQLQETGRYKIVVFMFVEDCVVFLWTQRERGRGRGRDTDREMEGKKR